MHEDCAFDQQQQEEAALFWAVSDTLHVMDYHGIKSFFDALLSSVSASEKLDIKSYFDKYVKI